MSDSPAARRRTRGVIWREFAAGDPVGKPLAEPAYRTPRFPHAIRASDLRDSATDVQQETALFWFWSNLKPYDLTGGHYFAFDTPGQGWGQAPFAPSRVSALSAIDSEFGGILNESLRRNLGDSLGGSWMWIEDDPVSAPASELQTSADLRSAILTGLDDLAAAIRQLAPAHGRIGHNGPPDELPLTPQEQAEALDTIEQTKAGLAAGGADGATLVKSEWARFAALRGGFHNYPGLSLT